MWVYAFVLMVVTSTGLEEVQRISFAGLNNQYESCTALVNSTKISAPFTAYCDATFTP